MPLVSFLMSNYKTPPAFLRRALDSIFAQTMPDFEVVIINDGVKDESYDVLLEYAAKDSRILLIENERNLGLAASLNRGIDACTGKYIARMDTDDICLPERLKLQTEYMEAHPDIMFAGAWADAFYEDEDTVAYSWHKTMCSPEEYRIRLLFSNEPLLVHPTVIFRKAFLDAHSLRYSEDQRFRYAEDYEMWTRCADHGAAGILERAVLKYRDAQTNDRITVRHEKEMRECVMHIQKKLLSRLQIAPDLYDATYHNRLLSGRKPYDLRYKEWIDLLLRQNKTCRIYDQKVLKQLGHDRWYTIVYYGIAKEKTFRNRLRCFLTLYPDGYFRFLTDMCKRVFQR